MLVPPPKYEIAQKWIGGLFAIQQLGTGLSLEIACQIAGRRRLGDRDRALARYGKSHDTPNPAERVEVHAPPDVERTVQALA
jgi:hypothetical protein